MRRLLPTVALAVLAVPVAVAVAAAPTVTTGAATNVTTSGATLNGTVDAGGEATSFRFQYGTSTSYSNSTPLSPAGSGTSAIGVSAPVSGLPAGTTIHYQVVAQNGTATINGADRTFVTGAAPGVSTGTPANVGSSSATLRATVDPNGLATTYRFQYGTSSNNLSRTTANTGAGSGNANVSVAANIGGLSANDRIYYRVTATNSAGTRNGSTRSFVTSKSLRIDSISVPRSRFGGSATIRGDLDGSGVNGTRVSVVGTAFPFSSPFAALGGASANRSGNFAIQVSNIRANTRIRIVAAGNITGIYNLYNGNRVGVKLRKGRRLSFSGTVTPAAANGLVRIQKRKSNGRWGNVRKGRLKPLDMNRSRYRLSARRAKGIYRVMVVPRDGGAHSSGYSRKLRVR